MDVVVHYNSDATEKDADATVDAIKGMGRNAIAIQGDLTKADNVTALFQQAKDHFGGIDVAVNTVGKVLRKPIIETTEAEFDEMMAINAKSAYFFIKESGLYRLRQGWPGCLTTRPAVAGHRSAFSQPCGSRSPAGTSG